MGKRELFIIVAFAATAFGVYQLTVPRRETDRPFSVATIFDNVSRMGRRERITANAHRKGTLEVLPAIRQVRLAGLTKATVIGEVRDDISWDLSIQVDANDRGSADGAASVAALSTDVVGPVLSLAATAGGTPRFTAELTLRVPARLAIRADGTRQTDVSGVAAVHLARVIEEAIVRDVPGALTGSHRNGHLVVARVGEVSLTLGDSRAEISDVRDRVRLVARNGESRIERVGGSMEVELDGHSATIVASAASVIVGGVNGSVRVEHPQDDVRIDVRRTGVAVVLDRAVPVVAFSTERRVELTIGPTVPVTVDAVTIDGPITATDLGLSPETVEHGARLRYRVGDDAIVALRNQRSEIVIARGK